MAFDFLFSIKKPENRNCLFSGRYIYTAVPPKLTFTKSAFCVLTYALHFYGRSTRQLLLTQSLRVRLPSEVHSFRSSYRNYTACDSLKRPFVENTTLHHRFQMKFSI